MPSETTKQYNLLHIMLKIILYFFLVAISIQVYFMQNDTYLPETIT